MSGRRAKWQRKQLRAVGLPDNGRTHGPNITDLDDTREMRRTKQFRKPQLAAEMRETDPIKWRQRTAFWRWVNTWLMHPMYRDALGDPNHRPRK